MEKRKKTSPQDSTDQESRRLPGDHVPLPSPVPFYSAKGAGAVSGGRGLVACACDAQYAIRVARSTVNQGIIIGGVLAQGVH